LAGSEKRGASNASANLFKNALCFLTKSNRTNLLALRKLARFWRELGCRIKVLTPNEHDRIVAAISHLPHLVAVELVNSAERNLDFAASGFCDTTRIASSESEIWTDIFLTNVRHTLQALDDYLRRLKSMRRLIAKKDRKRLNSEFKKARRLRNGLQD
ncbi:MAG: prephenate dehydrogenase/arogenate dehydrogenase family protein, partial [Candidatus Omnitrophica bacterium]|nr:prephenate dehydrogenase/arogenate dehydrogenase family protein [Candidatus Omnitrophota bacterium]